jgi:hypothetical protein
MEMIRESLGPKYLRACFSLARQIEFSGTV